VFILLYFLAGGDSSQDEAEDDVKQITVCPNFLFIIVQATVHKKASQFTPKQKDRKPQLVLVTLGLRGGKQDGLALVAQA